MNRLETRCGIVINAVGILAVGMAVIVAIVGVVGGLGGVVSRFVVTSAVPGFVVASAVPGFVFIVVGRGIRRRGSTRRRTSSGSRGLLNMLTSHGTKDGSARSADLTSGFVWRLMQAAARLMPSAAGERWLAEAESALAETPADRRREVISDYVSTAPQVIAVSWAGAIARLTKAITRGPTSR